MEQFSELKDGQVSAATPASNVPAEYYPNYQIAGKREQLISLLEDITAANSVGRELEASKFADLHGIFDDVFEYFPQSPSNNIIYRQCLLTTEDLANGYTSNKYFIFRDRCFSPIGEIVKQIQSKFTVKAGIVVKPKDGAAPLNVTLDARGSVDPSNDTIASQNFFRYYKDINGVDQPIGKGPVVNYTFNDPGNHIVHLTVRSSNNITEGIFDGTSSVSVNVAPRAANIVVYVDGKRANTDFTLKVGTQDATDGVFIDGTATIPIGARTIVEHVRTIQGSQPTYNFRKSGEGAPDQFQHIFPENGIYTLGLELLDNEGNRMRESYKISVSDPVASMKITPKEGTTSNLFTFDASASFSLTSRIRSYQWLITDPNGNQIEVLEAKDLKRKFSIPGTYTIRLTVTDVAGASSYDIQQIYVGSTPPIPTFKIESTSDLKYPSQFVLDAAGSFDEDVRNGADALTYERFFSPNQGVTVNRVVDEGKQLIISVDEPNVYKVKLVVEDSYGEQTQIEKDLTVTSTLRPELMITPLVANWGFETSFVAKTNKSVAFYDWDFGDGSKQQTKEPTVTHVYNKAGIYQVKLTVVTPSGESNEIIRQVFMGQQDAPIPAFEIKKGSSLLSPQSICVDQQGVAVPAFRVNRYEQVTLDASKSVNVLGGNSNLAIAFRPQNDEVQSKANLTYNFPVVGCQYIDLIVDDTNVGKTEIVRIRFDVLNALPTLQNLVLSFPQAGGGNPVGIGVPGAGSTSQREIFNDLSIDPIVVSLQAQGARDPDGVISHFVRYYYPSDDPNRIISVKITPSGVPSTTFVVPKPHYPTEYSFGVRIVDNDGGEQTSESLLGNGPIIFFPPGENSLDVPIVTLVADKVNARVGEEIAFTTKSSILSQRPDFDATKYFKYDFDGDGEVDLTTKEGVVRYAYQEPGEKKPKVTVYYRGRAGVGNAEPIAIQKSLTPLMAVSSFDKYVLVKDLSVGEIETRELCMDTRVCAIQTGAIVRDETTVLYTYPEYGNYLIRLNVLDTFGNAQARRTAVELTPPASGAVGLLTVPQAIPVDSGAYEIAIGRALNNEISLYMVGPTSQCGIDLDIAVDSDGEGNPTNDLDLNCNQLYIHQFVPRTHEQWARVWYLQDGQQVTHDIVIRFLDIEEIVVPEEYQRAYDEISEILQMLPTPQPNDQIGIFYQTLLVNLRASLGEKEEMSSLVIDLRRLLEEYPNFLDDDLKTRSLILLNSLSDSTVQGSFGGTIYDTSKANILVRLDATTQKEVGDLFSQFEAANGNPDTMKTVLDQVFQVAARERDSGKIDIVDFNYIKNNLCEIVTYYELPSKTCGTEGTAVVDDTPPESANEGSLLGKVIRIVLLVVAVLVVIFVILIIIFAIKAKRQKQAGVRGEEDATGNTEKKGDVASSADTKKDVVTTVVVEEKEGEAGREIGSGTPPAEVRFVTTTTVPPTEIGVDDTTQVADKQEDMSNSDKKSTEDYQEGKAEGDDATDAKSPV